MRIVHISDWHWQFQKLPEADLYVVTGDMLKDHDCSDKYGDRNIRLERIKQHAGMQKLQKNGGFSQFLGSPKAPLICVRGNHDFVEIAPLFADCNLVHEFIKNEVIEVLGMKITGHRGVPAINGYFSDEVHRNDLLDRVRAMEVSDVYVTHYPPDIRGLDGTEYCYYGLDGMSNNLLYRDHGGRQALHCFGHIHECGGNILSREGVFFSNAATTYNILEGSPTTGWADISPT